MFTRLTAFWEFLLNNAIWPLFVVAFAAATLFNQANLNALYNEGVALRYNQTVVTSDDASYLNPPENYLNGKEWRDNFPGEGSYYLRSPGYGLIYAGFKSFLSPKNALWGLKMLQVLAFSCSVVFLFRICQMFGHSRNLAFAIALFVGVNPMFHGFLYYTLTEGITPALVVVFFYSLLRAEKGNSTRFWIVNAFVLSALLLIRPPLIVLLLSWVVFCFSRKLAFKKNLPRGILLVCIAITPLLVWQVRNYSISGKLVGLHPIYHPENNDISRPIHGAIWEFEKSFGQTGYDFHKFMVPFWRSANEGKPLPEGLLAAHFNEFPVEVFDAVTRDSLYNAYLAYYIEVSGSAHFYKIRMPRPASLPDSEKKLISHFKHLARKYMQEHPFKSWIVVPAQVYWKMAAHSNLSLFIFQKTWRGSFLVECLRYINFAIHLLTFLLFPFCVLRNRRFKFVAIYVPVMAYLGYIAVFQRGIEERYTMPFIAIMLVMVWYFILSFVPSYTKKG